MKIKLMILLLFYTGTIASAQQVTIEFSYLPGLSIAGADKEAFHFDLNKKLYPFCTGEIPAHKPLSIQAVKSGSISKTVVTYALKDTSVAIFGDLFGHEVILIPGDTMKVTVGKLEKHNDILLPWYYSLAYSGPNQYIYAILDSIGFATGDVKSDMVNPKGKTADEFIAVADSRYQSRKSFLDAYCVRHGIPANIKEMIWNEIYAAYVRDLVFLQYNLKGEAAAAVRAVLSPKIDYKQLKSIPFSKAVTAAHVVYQYLLVMAPPFESEGFYSKTRFSKIYELIKKDFDAEMRADLLSRHFKQFITYGDLAAIDPSLKNAFSFDCRNERFVSYIDSVLNLKQKQAGLSFYDVMNTQVTDADGKSKTLKALIAQKPTLIDCWASWCKPCLDALPFSKELEEQYRSKVNFIYLSFDQDINAWQSKAKALKLQPTFYVQEGFNSGFAAYFKLNSIPRYIIIDAKGQLLNADAPRPGDAQLNNILNTL
jgi:thiol-disulfide isomerase/thioredoxin